MWQACRASALQQLLQTQAHAAPLARGLRRCAPVAQRFEAVGGAARFSSRAALQPLAVNGIALRDLAKRSRLDLESELGRDALRAAHRALPQTWDDLLKAHDADDSAAPPVSRELATQIFQAALKQQLPQLALSVFEYMDTAFPTQVDFVVYGEVFTLLSRVGKADETLAIFERNKPLYDADRPAPELIYRFGVFGLIGKRDFAGVAALVDEMQTLGLALSNELQSRVMIAYAKGGEREKVLEIFATLDPQVGRWHEADVDRVVNSLGLIHCPDEAFEFYRNAQIKLSGNTLVALLNVCRKNDRRKHAMAILANRKRFNLVLNVREYNKVLEALEAFDEHKEIAAVLAEMQDNGVAFDKLTRILIARNQHCLQGTPFALSSPTQRRNRSDESEAESADTESAHLSERTSRRKMQEFNASTAFAMAAGLADLHVTPLKDGAMAIPQTLAAEAVVAYANNGEHHKVKALVRGFGAVKGDFGYALTSVVSFYSVRDHAIVYEAFKASLFQGRVVFRVMEALARFDEFNDPDAAMALFRQAFERIAAALEANGRDYLQLKKTLAFDRAQVAKATLHILLAHHRLDDVVEVLNTLDANGFQVRTGDYTTVFRVMRETGKYSASDFDLLWDDMITHRGIQPSKAILAHSCVALASGTAAQQQRVLDAYALLRDRTDDDYRLPSACYTALLAVAANRSDLSAVQLLFDDAVKSHEDAKHASGKIRYYPREWVSTLVAKLGRGGGHADAAFALVMDMKARCGGYAYDAVLMALRMNVLEDKRAQANALRAILVGMNKFQLRVHDCEVLVRAATAKQSLALALMAIELFEETNLAPSPVTGDGPSARAFVLQQPASAKKLRAIADVYAGALALSKETDTASATTAFLQTRSSELASLQQQQ